MANAEVEKQRVAIRSQLAHIAETAEEIKALASSIPSSRGARGHKRLGGKFQDFLQIGEDGCFMSYTTQDGTNYELVVRYKRR